MVVERAKLEKICAYCDYMTFKRRPEPGWAYCNYWKTWFKNQKKEGTRQPGERTCPYWKQQFTGDSLLRKINKGEKV